MGGLPGAYVHDAVIDVCRGTSLGKAVTGPSTSSWAAPNARDGLRQLTAHALCRGLRPRRSKSQSGGIRGYKIHPGGGQSANAKPRAGYVGHMEEIRQVRKAVGGRLPPHVRTEAATSTRR